MSSLLESSSTSHIQCVKLAALGLAEAAGGDRRRADAQAAGDKRRARIVRHRVLVDGDVGAAQRRIGRLAGDALLDQVDQEQVIVGAAGDDVVAARDEARRPWHRAFATTCFWYALNSGSWPP